MGLIHAEIDGLNSFFFLPVIFQIVPSDLIRVIKAFVNRNFFLKKQKDTDILEVLVNQTVLLCKWKPKSLLQVSVHCATADHDLTRSL